MALAVEWTATSVAGVTAAGGIIGALIGQWGNRRINSGTIRTTDARTVWDNVWRLIGAMEAHSDAQDDEIKDLRAQVKSLRAEVKALRAELEAKP